MIPKKKLIIKNPKKIFRKIFTEIEPFNFLQILNIGDVSEWLKEHAWKACIWVTVSRVRIPASPSFLAPIV